MLRISVIPAPDQVEGRLQAGIQDCLDPRSRRVRRRLGFSQAEFALRIDVSLDTIRNWEQGKRCPTGAAKSLLKVLDKAPEAALAALH